MPRFLYYVNNQRVTMTTPEFRDGLGLSHIAGEDDQVENRQCMGPEGNGLIFARKSGGEGLLKYDAATQEWFKCDGGKWWLGAVNGQTPSPDDLQRPDAVGGHPIKLGDGQTWTVPVVTALPAAFGLRDGQIDFIGMDRYEGLRGDADRVYQKLMDDAAVQAGDSPESVSSLTIGDGFEIACRALAINYRVSKWELACLKVLTNANIYDVMEAIVDMPAIKAAAAASGSKKNADPSDTPDDSDTNSGSRDSHPDTSRPTQTSTG